MKNRTVNLDASAEILKLQGNLDILRLEQLDGGLQVVLALAGDPQAVALDCHGDLLELVAHRFAQRLGQLLAEPLAQLDHLLDAVAAHGFRGLKIEDLERQVALRDSDLPNTPALAVLLPDAQAKGVEPLLTGCHGKNVRQTRLKRLRSRLGLGLWMPPVLRQTQRQTSTNGCSGVHLTPCLECAKTAKPLRGLAF